MPKTVNCDYCNNSITRSPSHINRGKFNACSSHCRAKLTGQLLKTDFEYAERKRQIAKLIGHRPPLKIGRNHWNWKGGISKPNSRGSDYKYKQWHKDVLVKYNFTCQECGIRGGKLSAHHIKQWSEYKELRYDVGNGICLCYKCHMILHGLNKKVNI